MATTKIDPKSAALSERDVKKTGKTYEGLSREQLIEAYRHMYASRRVDDKEILLKRQQKIFFQISGAGHEAVGVAAAFALKAGYDWFYPYYRDRALCLALGATAYDMLLQAVGSGDDPSSGGRQMPSHWSIPDLNIVTGSSPTGTQILQAVGCAEVGRYYAAHPESARKATGDYREFKDVKFHGDEITYVSLGEGTSSEGEFWEALNTASNARLPLIFVVEDNGYAISVPVEVQTAGGNISRLVSGFPNFHFEEVDGTDPVASYAAFVRSAAHCRAGHGPGFVHAHVIRPYSHSLSDDERLYRPDVERQRDAQRDPITRMQMFLIREGILDEKGINQLEKQVDDDLQVAVDRALQAPPPRADSVLRYIYSPNLDPTSSAFETQPAPAKAEASDAKKHAPKTMADLITATLRDEMRRDERIVIFGEDVADCSREEYLKQKLVKGKGGVFKLTAGLQMEFGSDRVFNSPIAEANIVGRATGMAERGLKPVVEIQFFDYIWPAMMQLRSELPLIRWRSYNTFSAPCVIRVAIGGYLTGGAIYHSQCGESVVHAHTGFAGGVPFECFGRCRSLAHRDPLRRPRALPRTQTALSRNLRPRGVPGSGLHGAVRQSQSGAGGNRSDRDHLRRCRPQSTAGGTEAGARTRSQGRADRPAQPESLRLGDHCGLGAEDQPGAGGLRRHPELGLRRRNRSPHRRPDV